MRIITAEESGLDPETTSAYVMLGRLPDGRICGIHRLMYHWTLHVDISDCGHTDRYCLRTLERAQAALVWWNGVGDPPLFHKFVRGLMHGRASFNRDVFTGITWADNTLSPIDDTVRARGENAVLQRCLAFALRYETAPPQACECGRFTGEADAA